MLRAVVPTCLHPYPLPQPDEEKPADGTAGPDLDSDATFGASGRCTTGRAAVRATACFEEQGSRLTVPRRVGFFGAARAVVVSPSRVAEHKGHEHEWRAHSTS